MYLKTELYELIKTDESIFDFIQEGSLDGLWYWDLENPENEWMNARFWTVLGYHPDEMPHKSSAWQSIINQEDLKVATENLLKHCENPNHPYDQVVRYTHKDGSTKWIRCRGLAIRDSSGKPIRMLGAHQDISEIKNSETSLFNAKITAEESEEKYRTIFENINDAVFIHKILHNGEPGNFLYTNNAASDLLGYTSDELKLLSPKELDDPESSGKYIPRVMKELKKDRKSKFEAVQIAKDGRKIDVEVNAVVTKIGDDDQIVSVCRDITEKKASQRIIAEKEQFLSAIYKGISHSIFVVNVLEDGDFQYAGLNPQHEKITGLSTDFIKGKKPEDVLPAEVAMKVRNRYAECVNSKQTIAYEEWLPFKGKQTYWETILNPQINETGNVFQIIGTSQDISERKHSEQLVQEKSEEIAAQNEELNQANMALVAAKEKAEENEKLFKSVIENAPDGVVIINEHGNFKYISPNAERLFGYNTDEAIGHSGDEYTHPDDLPMVLKTMERILLDPNQKPKLEYRFKRKTGEYRWIETTFTNLLADNTINGIVLNFSDITEKKKIFEELLIAKENAERNEKELNKAQEIAHLGSWYLDIETNEVVWSEELYKMYGFDPAMPPPPYTEHKKLFTPESWDILSSSLAKTREFGIPYELELKTIKSDQSNGWMWVRGEAVFDENKKIAGLWGAAQDITERKQVEEALRKSQKDYQNLVENTPDIIYSMNEEGYFTFVSNNVSRYGFVPEEMMGHHIQEYIHPDDVEVVLSDLQKSFHQETPLKSVFRLAGIEGATLWFEDTSRKLIENDQIIGFTGIIREITKRKEAEEALLKSNQRLESLLDISRKITSTIDQNDIMQMVVDNAVKLMDLDTGAIYLKTDDETVNLSATTPALPDKFPDELRKAYLKNHPHLQKAMQTGNYVLMEDATTTKLTPEEKNIVDQRQLRTVLYHPIQIREKSHGVLILSSTETTRVFINEELEMLQAFANQAAHIIDNAKNYADLNMYTRELEKQIKQREKAEKELILAKEQAEESEERYALAIDASEQGIWDWNVETNEVFYSKQWKRQIGYDDHEIENDFVTWVEHLHPDEKADCQNAVQDYLNNPTEHFILTFRFRHKDGSYRWIHNKASSKINNEGKVVRMFGTHTDISERKHAENKIKSISRRLQLSTESANIGIWELDLKQNQLNWDKRMFELYGMAHENFIGAYETWKNGVHPEDIEHADAEVQEAIAGKKEFHTQFRVVWPNGEIRFLEAHAIVTRDPEGNPESMIGINWDITDIKTAEKNLIKAKNQAEESDRLKSAFLANMSHEIRTPMNGILGFADLLKTPDLTGDQQQKYIGIIEKSGARMLNIIDQIVDISKIEAGLMTIDIKETNINEQIEYICTFFKPEAEAKGINLSYNNTLTNNEAVIQTDREKVYGILSNLVKNAIKYTKKGAIELGYVLTDTTKAIEPGGLSGETEQGRKEAEAIPSSELQFYVKDTGIGIPKNRQEAIFERFIQADIEDRMAYQGAGLGLAITKAYVEMLGGKIWVESIEGEFSTFYFTLPYNTRSIKNTAEATPLTSEPYNEIRKLKILIAEDEEISHMLIDNYIKKFGKEIFKARTGLEAVEICRANPDIDLILMDIRMPYMDGYEATKQIRVFNKDVTIIAQTAYGLSGDREKAIKSGCNDYITKPIRRNALQALIQKCFEK